jgi:hypothetical protein
MSRLKKPLGTIEIPALRYSDGHKNMKGKVCENSEEQRGSIGIGLCSCCSLGSTIGTPKINDYFAYSTALVSRITVTLI